MRGLIPVEVKASDNATKSLCNLIEKEKYADIHYGIKLCKKTLDSMVSFIHFLISAALC